MLIRLKRKAIGVLFFLIAKTNNPIAWIFVLIANYDLFLKYRYPILNDRSIANPINDDPNNGKRVLLQLFKLQSGSNRKNSNTIDYELVFGGNQRTNQLAKPNDNTFNVVQLHSPNNKLRSALNKLPSPNECLKRENHQYSRKQRQQLPHQQQCHHNPAQ